jgi:hypothetical protein
VCLRLCVLGHKQDCSRLLIPILSSGPNRGRRRRITYFTIYPHQKDYQSANHEALIACQNTPHFFARNAGGSTFFQGARGNKSTNHEAGRPLQQVGGDRAKARREIAANCKHATSPLYFEGRQGQARATVSKPEKIPCMWRSTARMVLYWFRDIQLPEGLPACPAVALFTYFFHESRGGKLVL